MKDVVDLIARIFIAFIFFFEAYDSTIGFEATKKTMTDYNITWSQDFLLVAVIIVLLLGSTLVLIGYRSSFGALLLLLYWLPVTFIVHPWWNNTGDIQREQAIEFMKNFAIVGGLLMIVAYGSGRFSIRRLFATTKVP
ncbi:MAG: DoxX family protein [Bacteroidota bacterium]